MVGGTYSDYFIFEHFSCFFIGTDFFVTFFFQVSLEEFFQEIGARTLPPHENVVCFGGREKYYRQDKKTVTGSTEGPAFQNCLASSPASRQPLPAPSACEGLRTTPPLPPPSRPCDFQEEKANQSACSCGL